MGHSFRRNTSVLFRTVSRWKDSIDFDLPFDPFFPVELGRSRRSPSENLILLPLSVVNLLNRCPGDQGKAVWWEREGRLLIGRCQRTAANQARRFSFFCLFFFSGCDGRLYRSYRLIPTVLLFSLLFFFFFLFFLFGIVDGIERERSSHCVDDRRLDDFFISSFRKIIVRLMTHRHYDLSRMKFVWNFQI